MAETKATVRRLTSAAGEDFRRRIIRPFKTKENTTATKNCKHQKEWTNDKTINVRRKSRYFSGINRLIF